uniref:variable large family protein n=1 Tax=Borreliella valaisiana TaxID=62088 RepID=UPI001AED46D4
AAAGADGGNNTDAGKLFATNGRDDANADAINKAAKAVSGVSGGQILNAIVTSGDGNGANAEDATNPIDAAIGNDGNGQGFGENMNTDDKIAAAIVLRGMAKGGKFALAAGADNSKESLKATVESAVSKTIESLNRLVREAVVTGLKSVASTIKAAGNGENSKVGSGEKKVDK